MGKQAIKLKEVIYTLSPFEQSVMSGLAKDMPHKAAHYFKSVSQAQRPIARRRRGVASCARGAGRPSGAAIGGSCRATRRARAPEPARPPAAHPAATATAPQFRIAALWCGLPLYAIGYYCSDFKEKEKMHHRF